VILQGHPDLEATIVDDGSVNFPAQLSQLWQRSC
jgi:hypothetical protein